MRSNRCIIDNNTRIFSRKIELHKNIVKSLMKNSIFSIEPKLYFLYLFSKFSKFNSITYCRRYCILTQQTRSVFKNFKLVRHQVKFYIAKGHLVGLRKVSF